MATEKQKVVNLSRVVGVLQCTAIGLLEHTYGFGGCVFWQCMKAYLAKWRSDFS